MAGKRNRAKCQFFKRSRDQKEVRTRRRVGGQSPRTDYARRKSAKTASLVRPEDPVDFRNIFVFNHNSRVFDLITDNLGLKDGVIHAVKEGIWSNP